MRKLLIITCLLSTVFVAFGQKKKKNKKQEAVATSATSAEVNYKEIGAPMPPIRMVTADKKVITEADVANDANLFIMLFNPTCGHCQEETGLIGRNIELFKKSKVLLLASPNMNELLGFFESTTDASKYQPVMQVGLDSADFITKTFRYEALPQINIYDKNRKLIKVLNGDAPLDSFKEYIE